jgi:hypothetical protein
MAASRELVDTTSGFNIDGSNYSYEEAAVILNNLYNEDHLVLLFEFLQRKSLEVLQFGILLY